MKLPGRFSTPQTDFKRADFVIDGRLITSSEPSDEPWLVDDPADLFAGLLLMVQGWRDGEVIGLGTAVLVAPGLAFAAAHVHQELEAMGFWAGNSAIFAMAGRPGLSEAWRVTTALLVPNSDLVVLEIALMRPVSRNHEFFVAMPSPKIPVIGESVCVAGFRELNAEYEAGGRHQISAAVLMSMGPVTAIYPNGRDRMLPGPCFEVRCTTIGGMSGGPAFDANGQLVGIISTSLDAGAEGEPAMTFVSLLWPALIAEIHPSWPPGLVPVPIRARNHPGMLARDQELLEGPNEAGNIVYLGPR